MQTFRLTIEQTGKVIGSHVVCADTSLSRLVGLLGKTELEQGAGVWLQPSSGVHTLGMRFAIDVLGLDEHLRVVRLWAGLQPWRFTCIDLRVRSVVELAQGSIEAHRIAVDDRLKFTKA